MFAIFEPKTFDTARSDEPSTADLILTISSGADVAKETTVIPISILAILNFKEIPQDQDNWGWKLYYKFRKFIFKIKGN